MQLEYYVVTTNIYKNIEHMTYDEKQNLERLQKTKKRLSLLFKGLTVFPNLEGFWFNEDTQKLEKDNVEIWRILFSPDDIKNLRLFHDIEDFARTIKQICTQQTQLYTIDNKPYFV